jgi:hypothetical protein
MAEITKQALQVSNNTSFPNNNAGAITPSALRAFNSDMIDSLVDEIGYNADSASWNRSINALNTFTSSQQPSFTALNAFTASQLSINSGVNTFTQSATGRLNNLEAYTASFTTSVGIYDEGTFVNNVNQIDFNGNGITASFISGKASVTVDFTQLNASTASQQISINNLNTNSASVNTSITNVNSATASLFTSVNNLNTSASLALVTASFDTGTRNLTFTKGNTTQFSVNIPDVSGSAGNFVTTSSFNSYTASTDSSISQLNASSASQQTSINALNAATSSYVTSAITASSLVTASFSGNTLTFTKGDASTFGVVIPDISGSTINTGSFATTGSNTFTGNQTISTAGNSQLTLIAQPGFQTNVEFQSQNSNFQAYGDFVINNNGQFGGSGSIKILSKSNQLIMAADQGFLMGVTNGIGNGIDNSGAITINVPSGSQQLQLTGSLNVSNTLTASLAQGYVLVGDSNNRTTLVATSSFGSTIDTGSYATTGSNTFTGTQTINADLYVSGNTNVGFLNIADEGGINLAGTGSIISSYGIVTNPSNGDLVFNTNPNNGRLMTFSATTGKMTQFNGLYFNAGDGNSVNGGISLSTYSGSLFLTPVGFSSTTASMLHVSSSSNINNVNLILKNSNTAADTILSGSNNIFANPAAPTAGFKRYMTGGNISVGGNGVAIPQISGSMAFSPTISNNYFGVSANPITLRGPISSSAYTINNNALVGGAINLGTSAAFNFERAINGLSITNNVLAGAINAIASKTQLSSSVSIGNNIIGGTVSLNMDSSSISFQGNSLQGQLTINNSYFPATTGAQLQSQVNGGLYIGTHTIFTSGSNTTFTGSPGRTISNAILLGTNNTISASLNGDLTQVHSTALIGQGLVVVGTNSRTAGPSAADWGSVFVGRWNSIDGVKDQTAENVFVVGVGTSNTARKTALLIDSGSNTFIEGTLNVSGSTTMTGSLILSSSAATELTVIGNAEFSGSLSIQSGSSFYANGNKQFNVGAFSSLVTQSGSAGVSQSVNFDTTDISEGVSVVSNSRITLANGGTYNIQFSAQVDRVSGSGTDTVYIWLKKNGVNYNSSAGVLTVSGGAAAAKAIASWNYVVEAVANDYFELVWQASDSNIELTAFTPSGNIPTVPSIILTVTQVR